MLKAPPEGLEPATSGDVSRKHPILGAIGWSQDIKAEEI